ncbi:MAG: DUF4339 domain-containing protein [Acidobacteriota bacterium]
MAEELWYYEKNGQQFGPVSQSELEALIERGEISREDLAWKPGEKDWSETGTFEMLVPSFKTPPKIKRTPPPPPPPPPVPTRTSEVTPPPAPPAAPPASSGPPPPPDAHHGQYPPRREKKPAWPSLLATLTRDPRTKLLAVIVVLLFVIVLLIWLLWPHDEPPETVATTNLHGTRVPVGYTGPVGQIKIDAYPHSELLSLTNSNGSVLAVPGSQTTPLVLLVPPDTYNIDLRGGSCDISVVAEQSRTCSKIVRAVDAATYYQEIGW